MDGHYFGRFSAIGRLLQLRPSLAHSISSGVPSKDDGFDDDLMGLDSSHDDMFDDDEQASQNSEHDPGTSGALSNPFFRNSVFWSSRPSQHPPSHSTPTLSSLLRFGGMFRSRHDLGETHASEDALSTKSARFAFGHAHDDSSASIHPFPSQASGHLDEPPGSDPDDITYAPRRTRLKCIEFDTEGGIVEREMTRKQILEEVNRPSDADVPFKTSFRRTQQGHVSTRAARRDVRFREQGREQRPRNSRARPIDRTDLGTRRNLSTLRSPAPIDQSALVIRNPLTLRDIRQVDQATPAKAALWVRQNCLVVSLESVRAIILYNKAFVFDCDNVAVQPPISMIRQRLSSGVMNAEQAFIPFEFRVLEGILIHCCMALEQEFTSIREVLLKTLEHLPTNINLEHLELLRRDEIRLNHFYARSRKVQNVLQSVLDEDEDMADMYLTEKHRNGRMVRNTMEADEVEILLESYLQMVDDLTGKAELLNRAIDDTENVIEIHLDSTQNQLLLVDLLISAISTILSFGTTVTAIFGMNLPLPTAMSSLPWSQYYFYGCVTILTVSMGVSLFVLLRWCRRQGLYSRKSRKKTARASRKGAADYAHQQASQYRHQVSVQHRPSTPRPSAEIARTEASSEAF